MEDKSDQKKEIEILKGDKLFNKNTPFIINLFHPKPEEKDEKRVYVDLICVIDISGSMRGERIEHVRESLQILVDMMKEKDRIALVEFSTKVDILYDLKYLDKKNKSEVKDLIKNIKIKKPSEERGTNITTGLEAALGILKKEKNNKEGRSSSIILFSDGCDNYFDDVELGEKLKSLTEGEDLNFTLNTFGYGYDQDTKIMNRLANLRDGSYYFVEDYKKVGEYFTNILGGCINNISKKSELEVKILNEKSKIVKVFGKDKLYSYELTNSTFKNKMLQFISGKEYTTVLEIFIDESNVKPGDILLEVNFKYEDIITKKEIKLNSQYKYELKDKEFSKVNEEYIRRQTYYIIDRALKLRENDKYKKGYKLLEVMEAWLEKNYKGENKKYLEDILKSKKLFENIKNLHQASLTCIASMVNQGTLKRMRIGNIYSKSIQKKLLSNYKLRSQSQSQPLVLKNKLE